MQSKELLVSALRQSYGLVMPLLEDLQSAALIVPTTRGGNHAHWILGHFAAPKGIFAR